TLISTLSLHDALPISRKTFESPSADRLYSRGITVSLPQSFLWSENPFYPIATSENETLLVADSWRVRSGATRGLDDHVQRFMASIATQSPEHLAPIAAQHITAMLDQQLRELAQQDRCTDFSPRISVEACQGAWRIAL